MVRRKALTAALGLAALAAGCYEMTWFYPAPGQGSLVTSGRRLGVAKRLSGEDPQAQSFIVFSVEQAYTSAADGGLSRTVVQVRAEVVNRAPAPARFHVEMTRLEAGGRAFAPKWRSRLPELVSGDQSEIAPESQVRYELYFDLEAYPPGRYSGAPPLTGGVPLATLTEFTVSWEAEWAGEKTKGKFRFVRDYTGSVGAGWAVAPGPYWGYGWWYWPYPWPTGVLVHRAYYPWRYYHYVPAHPHYKVRRGGVVGHAVAPSVKTKTGPAGIGVGKKAIRPRK